MGYSRSIHVNAYDALPDGDAGPLADASFPPDQPLVAVCRAGQVSQKAAQVLSQRGFDARSLEGGMKAWSLAWNIAEVPPADASIRIWQVRRTGKGCLSYVVGSEGDAIVIDPSLPPEIYVNLAARYDWRIRYVLETHIHADHLSRARLLTEQTNATLVLPPQRRVHFPFTEMADGDRIEVGAVRITARATPGHTEESTSYVLNQSAVLTGDTLFTNGVGRPDLHADAGSARQRATVLFGSLERLSALGRGIVVLPGHTTGPVAFDGRAVSARMGEVAAWLDEWLESASAFVERILSRLPAPPPNFARIARLNELGAFPAEGSLDLEAGPNRCAVS